MWRTSVEVLGLDPGDEGAPYDGKAAVYDRLVRSRLYNRLMWAASPRDYEAFARRALADGEGPLLDVAGGSAAATATLYAAATRDIVLVDRSRAMLERAGARIAAAAPGGVVPAVRFVQADALALPLPPHGFETALCMGFAHIVDRPAELLGALRRQVRPGGRIYLTSLVAERAVGSRYLRMLHRAGEVAEPRTAAELEEALGGVRVEVRGCMGYAVVQA